MVTTLEVYISEKTERPCRAQVHVRRTGHCTCGKISGGPPPLRCWARRHRVYSEHDSSGNPEKAEDGGGGEAEDESHHAAIMTPVMSLTAQGKGNGKFWKRLQSQHRRRTRHSLPREISNSIEFKRQSCADTKKT